MTPPPDLPVRAPDDYRAAFEHLPFPMWVYDRETLAFLAVNDAACRTYGRSRDEFLGMTIRDIRPAEDVPELERRIAAMEASTLVSHASRHRLRDGAVRDVEVTSFPLAFAGRAARLVLAQDVTDRRTAEGTLRARESNFRTLVEQASDGIIVTGPDDRITECNARITALLGYEPAELVGRPLQGILAPDDPARAPFRLADVRARRSALVERVVVRRDGRRVPVEISIRALDDGRLHAILRDISVRKRAEDALRLSESHYRSLVQNAPIGIYRSSAGGGFLAVNPALVAMLGYASEDELLAADVAADVYADPRERARLIAQYEATGRVDPVEVDWKRKDGSVVTVRLSGHAVKRADGEPEDFEMLVEDVTEQRALEDQLRRAQKMEAVGQLAGGVAHDFGNLITAIMGYSDLLLRGIASDDPRRHDVLEIKATAARAGTLTRQLLAYSRRQVLAPQVLDVSTVVADMAAMLRRLIGEHIQLVTVSRAGLGRIRADRGQLEQVAMNLAVNARDAMPSGGTLTIETANVDLAPALARRLGDARPGPHVMLAVTDTGIGMDDEIRGHLFEPFFTTKGPGQGTGLGLATVYGIVRQSGGAIAVESAPGEGTTFRIYFPRVFEEAGTAAGREESAAPLEGHGTILLVEDEAAVRAPLGAFLTSLGYTVVEAETGADALARLADARTPDIVVSDVVMPAMSGPELARRVRSTHPSIPVILMSGYPDREIRSGVPLPPGITFVAKPFSPEALARHVKEALAAPATR